MSRGIIKDPVVTRSGTDKIVLPVVLRVTSVVLDPVCRQFSGAQTAIPDIPPTR